MNIHKFENAKNICKPCSIENSAHDKIMSFILCLYESLKYVATN